MYLDGGKFEIKPGKHPYQYDFIEGRGVPWMFLSQHKFDYTEDLKDLRNIYDDYKAGKNTWYGCRKELVVYQEGIVEWVYIDKPISEIIC